MLGLGKLRVLESKLDIYEDLSKEMLDKLERAVSSIQETNNRVAVILERHENRLDEGERANDSIIRLIEKVEEDVKSLEAKVDSLSRFRWVALGVAATAMLIVNVLQISSDSFGPTYNLEENV